MWLESVSRENDHCGTYMSIREIVGKYCMNFSGVFDEREDGLLDKAGKLAGKRLK